MILAERISDAVSMRFLGRFRVRADRALVFAGVGLVLVACGGGAPSTQALIERVATGNAKAQAEAAQTLAARLDPAIAAQIDARASADARATAGRALFRDELQRLYREATAAPARRSAAVRSLGRLSDATSTAALVDVLLSDRNSSVQEVATTALTVRMPLQPILLARLTAKLDTSAGDAPRTALVERVLARGGVSIVRTILTRVPDAAWARDVVRDVGLVALPFLREQLRNGEASTQVAAALGLLELREKHAVQTRPLIPKIIAAMLPQLGAAPTSNAVRVLALVGRPATNALVALKRRPYEQLHGAERHAWQYVDVTLADMWAQDHLSVADLVGALARRDYALICLVDVFFVELGKPGSEQTLIDALNAKGNSGMALDFLLSGNTKLGSAARRWAAQHNYTVVGGGTTGMWGAARSRPLEH